MNRITTACLAALLAALIATSAALAVPADEAKEPVDIRPAQLRLGPAASQKKRIPKHQPISAQAGAAQLPAGPAPGNSAASKKRPAATHKARVSAAPAIGADSKPKQEPAAAPDRDAIVAMDPDKAPPSSSANISGPIRPANSSAVTSPENSIPGPSIKPAAPVDAKITLPPDFCANIVDLAAETRARVRADQIASLETDLRKRVAELEAKKAEVQSWVEKQEEIRKRADENVIAILAKMKPEAAAAEIALMEDPLAGAVLMKLGPKTASLILNEIGASKAAKITEAMMASRVASRDNGVKSAN